MKRLGFLLCLLSPVCLFVVGCGSKPPLTTAVQWMESTRMTTKPAGSPPSTEPVNPATSPPAFTLTAQEFYDEYTRRPQEASKKYRGKVIELSGTIKGFGTNTAGQRLIYLQVGMSPLGVECQTSEEKPWDKAAKGAQVRIKGKWPESSSVGCLVESVVVDR